MNVHGCTLDLHVDAAEVVQRVNGLLRWILEKIASHELPDINVHTSSKTLTRRSLIGSHPESAEHFARIFAVLRECKAALVQGVPVNQREVYYRLKAQELVRCQRDVSCSLLDCVSLLNVPRNALGVLSSGKGLVSGSITLHTRGREVDCTQEAFALPGDVEGLQRFVLQSAGAAFVLVIEKETVFQALTRAQLWEECPCILVTARGMPDLATRAFLSHVSKSFPRLPLFGLVDWNPDGLAILSLYRFGSAAMALESPRFTLPGLRWAGVHASWLQTDGQHMQALTQRDLRVAQGLRERLRGPAPHWAAELDAMLAAGRKADIEALPGALAPTLLEALRCAM
ncbi:SPO11B [Auxenochlorella protothecoides x Auxenochlorella symbiontica]